jgi:AcrR family transcriptional regulator
VTENAVPLAATASEDAPTEVPIVDTTDGRAARRIRNRMAVLDAAIALFAEGNLQPSPGEIAARSKVSHRSINRYFPDNRALLRAAVDRQIEIGIPLFRIHAIGEGPLEHRIDEFVKVRLDSFEVLGATARAAALMSATSRIVRTELAAVRDLLTDQVDRQFDPELRALPDVRREASRTAVDALFQFESLDFYCRLRGLDQPTAHQFLCQATRALLAPAPDRTAD